MADNDPVLTAARAWRGEPLALATVVSTWGSAPRPKGSHMLVHRDGRFEGSVSGGCVETDILITAAEVIAGAPAIVKTYGVADDAAWEVGLPCGGEIAVLVQPVNADGFDPDLFEQVDAARGAGRTLTVATNLSSGRSTLATVEGGFVNRYYPPNQLLIVGAVQIAQSLVGIARELGIATVVIDPRSRFLTDDRFPDIRRDDRWPDDAIASYNPGCTTAIVTLSHDTKIDDPALVAALRSPASYIAALGSRRSHVARLERLRAQGFSDTDLERIDGPAGVAIGAIGPAEIALSIAAGMVKAFRT